MNTISKRILRELLSLVLFLAGFSSCQYSDILKYQVLLYGYLYDLAGEGLPYRLLVWGLDWSDSLPVIRYENDTLIGRGDYISPEMKYPKITGKLYDELCTIEYLDIYNNGAVSFMEDENEYTAQKKRQLDLYYMGHVALSNRYDSHLIMAVSNRQGSGFYVRTVFLINLSGVDHDIVSLCKVSSMTHLEGYEDRYESTLVLKRNLFDNLSSREIMEIMSRIEGKLDTKPICAIDSDGKLVDWICNQYIGPFHSPNRIMTTRSDSIWQATEKIIHQSNYKGNIMISFEVDALGKTKNHEIMRGSFSSLDSTALVAAKELEYIPCEPAEDECATIVMWGENPKIYFEE